MRGGGGPDDRVKAKRYFEGVVDLHGIFTSNPV